MRHALLVIDVQRGLFGPQPQPFEAREVIARINALSQKARAAVSPVFFIQHEDASESLPHGSANWELADGLHVEASDHRIRKTTPDSFLRTELKALLQKERVSQLVIAGYASEFCVDTTVRSAAAQGYPVILASDAHTTHDQAHATGSMIRLHHNVTLPNITSFGVKIRALPSEEISFQDA